VRQLLFSHFFFCPLVFFFFAYFLPNALFFYFPYPSPFLLLIFFSLPSFSFSSITYLLPLFASSTLISSFMSSTHSFSLTHIYLLSSLPHYAFLHSLLVITERLKRRKTFKSVSQEFSAWKIDLTEVDIKERQSAVSHCSHPSFLSFILLYYLSSFLLFFLLNSILLYCVILLLLMLR
jgi:hypothetical protein